MIVNLRKEYGLTQKELGQLIHVDASTVSQWEKGSRMIKSEMLESLLEVLNVELVFQKKERDISRIFVSYVDIENTNEKLDDWLNEFLGGNFEGYYKEFKTTTNKKVVVQLSNAIKDAWVLYEDENKSSFLSYSLLKKNIEEAINILEYEEMSSEILIYDGSDEDKIYFQVTSLGYLLFDRKTLEKIAFSVALLTY